jgi:hypothetical protein
MLCSLGNDIVNKYFLSWQKHDIGLLNTIFHKGATYEIICLKRKYIGLKEITNYWNRNARRQKDITIDYKIYIRTKNKIYLKFNSIFFDVEECERQRIDGKMIIYIKRNRICYLKENYTKLNIS